ncbi:MAG: hypothetical protein M3Z16_01420 [Pseudomonadota bacterium]|nr:hypothetical protein [Pseudomonadota bacterium]
MKTTGPLGLKPETVAVNVTLCPTAAGFGLAASTVLLLAALTVSAKALDVAVLLLASPP